jgi:hypothetical protein
METSEVAETNPMVIPLDWCMHSIYHNQGLTPAVQEACKRFGIPDIVINLKLTTTQTLKVDRFDLIQKLGRAWKRDLHYGYPLPDERGRPHLNWLKCAHPACGKECKHASELAMHLIKSDAYTRGYHIAHESAVERTGITPEIVRAEQKTQCPSLICTQSKFADPAGLIDHITRLGIPPFWTPTTKISEIQDPATQMTSISQSKTCLICQTAAPEVLFIPCGHMIFCADCYKTTAKCLECNQKVCNSMLY